MIIPNKISKDHENISRSFQKVKFSSTKRGKYAEKQRRIQRNILINVLETLHNKNTRCNKHEYIQHGCIQQ